MARGPRRGLRSAAMSAAHVLVVLTGLAVAGLGSALLNNWRGVAVAWDELDSMFPPFWRTPAPIAGIVIYGLGAALSLLPLLR